MKRIKPLLVCLPLVLIVFTLQKKPKALTFPIERTTTCTITGSLRDTDLPKKSIWTTPLAQSKDGLWSFELFSPPYIYISNNKTCARPYFPITLEALSPIRIIRFSPEIYPIVFEGHFEDYQHVPQLIFHHLETHETFHASVGETIDRYNYSVLEFNESYYNNKAKALEPPQVIIKDTQSHTSIALSPQEMHTTEAFTLEVSSQDESSSSPFILNQAGENFNSQGVCYTLRAINPSAKQATFEMQEPAKLSSSYITLSYDL